MSPLKTLVSSLKSVFFSPTSKQLKGSFEIVQMFAQLHLGNPQHPGIKIKLRHPSLYIWNNHYKIISENH